MREDMATVVTERPRGGARIKTPKGEKQAFRREMRDECESRREKIRFKWNKGRAKYFTDVLGPIYGYILKQVGRPWDDVYSEICQNLPDNSLNTSHVRDHVKDFVETNVMLIDGVPYDSKGDRRVGMRAFRLFAFYVHPVTGLLCKIKRDPNRWRRRKKNKKGIDVPGEWNKQYHCIEGVWYMLTVKRLVYSGERMVPIYDMGYKRSFNFSERIDLYGGDLTCALKKQLNSKEVKKAGLNRRKPR